MKRLAIMIGALFLLVVCIISCESSGMTEENDSSEGLLIPSQDMNEDIFSFFGRFFISSLRITGSSISSSSWSWYFFSLFRVTISKAEVNSLGLGNKVYFTGYLSSTNVQKM